MTTSITVTVPETADYDVAIQRVELIESMGKTTYEPGPRYLLKPGEAATYHIWDKSQVSIMEIKHAKPTRVSLDELDNLLRAPILKLGAKQVELIRGLVKEARKNIQSLT